ncbi:MAG: esterase/lipase [Phycisphaerales bacterium]|nr:esterase/lipase [Phycisphaerales bacterium]
MFQQRSRRQTIARAAVLLVFIFITAVPRPSRAAAPADSTDAAANSTADDLARATADRFARAMDKGDVAAATPECSLPWMNGFGETAQDAAGLKRGLELYSDFARRFPKTGLSYRGIVASLPFDQFHEKWQAAPKQEDGTHRMQLQNLDALKLAAADRVVFVRWARAYSILVRVRDGKATVAGLGPVLPQDVLDKAAADQKPYRQIRDIVYGRKYGTALTLDVLTPTHGANGAAVIYMLSGDFVSVPMPETDNWVLAPLLSRGYTVITVTHGAIPKYTMPEIVRDVYRAVRFTRFHARDYGIAPNRIGVTGSSSGGYLALMLATARDNEPPLADGIDPMAKQDAIDSVSCRVQAAGCFSPPTDWLDYGAKDKCILDVNWGGPQLQGMLEFREFDQARFTFVPVKDREKIQGLLSELSPARRVTKDAAPTLILHGEIDPTVPLQQSQLMIERLKAAGVPAELVVKPGAGHGWEGETRDLDQIASWFDRYLPRRP